VIAFNLRISKNITSSIIPGVFIRKGPYWKIGKNHCVGIVDKNQQRIFIKPRFGCNWESFKEVSMMCRNFSNVIRLLLALIFLFAACAPLSTGVQAAENDKPNIVLGLKTQGETINE
jgi:hypothetical protein